MDASPSLTGLWAGEYVIEKPLARGGMATVYAAHARSLDTTVALKVLASRFAQDPTFRERFHAEATSIAALHHPNIIEVHHFGEEQGLAYIAMRFVPGGTLKERLEALGGPMDLRTAARLVAQVAAALDYAHQHAMIHLDVKPGNVLLGNADWPLLSDFGIIRMAGDAREDGHRVAGTPAYMSPEQWQGGPLDGRSDQYSLGLMFYEMVTGRRPFVGETSAELKAQHLAEPPPRPRLINPGIPGPVEEVMLRALAKDPADRYPTTADFGAALVEAVERSRGMQLETKQAIVSAAPNLVALAVLSVVAPFLDSLPNPDLPVFRSLTLDWPVMLLIAVLQIALLLGIRWQLIGIANRLMGAVVDGLDRFTRSYVRVGTDAAGPLHVAAWRGAALSTAEGLVNVAYLFIIYQLVALPLIKTVALAIDPGLEDLVATGLTALVLLVAAGIVISIYRMTGPMIAVCVMAICWAFISAMPLIDRTVLGAVSLPWLVKLVVGLGVLAAFLAVRPRVQAATRGGLVPPLDHQLRGWTGGRSGAAGASSRSDLERSADGLVDVLYLIVGYPIIALPLWNVLVGLVSPLVAAALITVGGLLVAGVLVNRLRAAGGVVPATLGLVIVSPTLLALPLFADNSPAGTSFPWVARLILGLGVLALFLGVRVRIRAAMRPLVVPAVAHQLGSLVPAASEAEAASRLRVLERFSDALVDTGYLIVGYFAVVGPVTSTLAQAGNLAVVETLVYAAFVLAVVYVVYGLVRGLLPALRPTAPVPLQPAPAG